MSNLTEEMKTSDCPICYEPFALKFTTQCPNNHKIHTDCFEKMDKKKCPMCRFS